MSSYQPMSEPPPEGHGPQQPVEAPSSIRTAVNIVWAIVAMSLIGLVLNFVYFDEIIETATQGMSESETDAVRTGTLVGALFFGLVFAALWAVMGIFLRKGKNWARIVLTVLAGLAVVFGLLGFAGEQPVILLVVGIITLALEIALLFFLWKKESSAFLQAR